MSAVLVGDSWLVYMYNIIVVVKSANIKNVSVKPVAYRPRRVLFVCTCVYLNIASTRNRGLSNCFGKKKRKKEDLWYDNNFH